MCDVCNNYYNIIAYTFATYAAKGAFHSTKISGNFGSKSNGTESFVSKITVHLLRLSFFLEIWKFQKIPVPFGISTQNESVRVPLFVKSYKMAASLSSQH